MKIFNRERQGGKTHSLVEVMMRPGNEDVIYVAPTVAQAQGIALTYARRIDPRVDPKRFISVAELTARAPGGHYPTPRYVIDELEGVLQFLTGANVVAVAGTDEDLEYGQMREIRGER